MYIDVYTYMFIYEDGAYLPISKLHSILTEAYLFAHNNLWLCYYGQVNSLYTAKIKCSFEMGK